MEFSIHLSLTYHLTFRTLSIIVYSDTFRHISVLFGHIQPYCDIFKTLCNSCIFRTLPYSESWHIKNPRYTQNSVKAYSGIFRTLCNIHIFRTCHIQNFLIFRILASLGPEAHLDPAFRIRIRTQNH